jgi:hypothetical protein
VILHNKIIAIITPQPNTTPLATYHQLQLHAERMLGNPDFVDCCSCNQHRYHQRQKQWCGPSIRAFETLDRPKFANLCELETGITKTTTNRFFFVTRFM